MPPQRQYNSSASRIEGARLLTKLLTKEFKKQNPMLDVTTLTVNKGANNGVNLENKLMGQVPLHPNVKSVICATVFGDGSIAIQKGYANARIQYRHSTRQTEWFLWKSLGPFGKYITENSIQFQAPDGFQKKAQRLPGELLGKLRVSTAVDPAFTALMPILAPPSLKKKGGSKKQFARSWLNHMTSWFLVTLWLDDGGLSGGGKQGVINVNGYPTKDAEVLADYISVVWGAHCKVANYKSRKSVTNPDSPQIVFVNLDNLKTFLRIVAPLIPVKSMLYKVCLFPSDDIHLQRWTSELKGLVRPDWHDEIDKIYAYNGVTPGQNLDPNFDVPEIILPSFFLKEGRK